MSLSCFELGERMLTVEEALAALYEFAPAVLPVQVLGLEFLAGRVLAQDVRSAHDVPQNTNAAMDGIAVAWPEVSAQAPIRWRRVGEVLAGHRHAEKVPAGCAVAITTGAPLPAGTDTVIMREQLEEHVQGDATWFEVTRAETVYRGQNVRQSGEDIARGSLALSRGTRLKSQHLGLLASLGVASAEVYQAARVAIFSTGDEVTAPGEPLDEAGIYDANRYALRGLLSALGCEVIDLGILPDDRSRIHTALQQAAAEADIVLTSGGVSVGQADWIRPALGDSGDLGFWRIAIRPGRPLAFGRLGDRRTPFFGLPGNPVAVMVTFLQFVQPMLRRLQGEAAWQPLRLSARAEESLKSRCGRVDFLRGIYHADDEGTLWVRSTGRQGSGILSSMVAANCLIEITAERDGVAPDETVIIQPFGELT